VKFLKKLNPEKNLLVRAVLYLVGIGGALHFTTLFIIAIKEHNWVWFNPLFAVDVDRVFPSLKNTYLTFFGGWLAMALGVWVIYKILQKSKN
jgi:hypothetical protein